MSASGGAVEASGEQGYPGSVVLAGVLATLFFPVISLIVALVLLGSERVARKREQLRTWAWASAGWIALQAVFFVLAFAVIWNGTDAAEPVDLSGPCVGGPVLDEQVETDERGRAVFPCAISGTATVTLP